MSGVDGVCSPAAGAGQTVARPMPSRLPTGVGAEGISYITAQNLETWCFKQHGLSGCYVLANQLRFAAVDLIAGPLVCS